MSQDNKGIVIPTGEAQVGRVQAPAPSDAPKPLVEHEVKVPQEPTPEPAAPAEVSVPEQAVEAPQPEPVLSEPVVVAEAPPEAKPLQESVPVPIPVRMNQLTTEHRRLRNELEALERSLKKPLN